MSNRMCSGTALIFTLAVTCFGSCTATIGERLPEAGYRFAVTTIGTDSTVAAQGQDPKTTPAGQGGQEPSAFERMFAGKTAQDLANQFPSVSAQTFQEAFRDAVVQKQTKEQKADSLSGFNFGTGIGATFDLHHGSRVKAASIRDGTVRIDEEGDVQLGLVLETHYFVEIGNKRLAGIGPFVAIKTGENDLIDEAGLGVMVGFRRTIEDTNSFNIGVGVMVDPDAEVLADGFIANQPAPAGATDVATKKEERFSFAIVFSYTF